MIKGKHNQNFWLNKVVLLWTMTDVFLFSVFDVNHSKPSFVKSKLAASQNPKLWFEK
jgi:hypothetical protein